MDINVCWNRSCEGYHQGSQRVGSFNSLPGANVHTAHTAFTIEAPIRSIVNYSDRPHWTAVGTNTTTIAFFCGEKGLRQKETAHNQIYDAYGANGEIQWKENIDIPWYTALTTQDFGTEFINFAMACTQDKINGTGK